MQRYRCHQCHKVFQSKRRKEKSIRTLWNDYVWGKQNLKQIAKKECRSIEWVRNQFDTIIIAKKEVAPQTTVIIVDTTFFGRTWGVCVFRAPHFKKNIWWQDVNREIMSHYYYGRMILEEKGWKFTAAVVDGKRGMTTVFKDIPVQVCQFHQMKNVTRYITRKPETIHGKALRQVMLRLPSCTEKEFEQLLSDWKKEYGYVLTDKTYIVGTKRWYYTHKKTRSAYCSLERNMPYLFTYLRYPEFNIPNTTNSLDGFFTHLKDKVDIHHGLQKDRRYKVIEEILGGEN